MLIDVAKKRDEIEIDEAVNDLPIEGLMMLTETSGAFDFLKDEKEDIYTVDEQQKLKMAQLDLKGCPIGTVLDPRDSDKSIEQKR